MRPFFQFCALSLALSAFGGVAGCAGATDDDTSTTQDELRTLTIGDGDKGKTFNVEKGQSFKVALGSNPTTGYKWMVASTTKTLGYPTPKEGEIALAQLRLSRRFQRLSGDRSGVEVAGRMTSRHRSSGSCAKNRACPHLA